MRHMSDSLNGISDWEPQGKAAISPRLQALLCPDRPCLVPISPNTHELPAQRSDSAQETSARSWPVPKSAQSPAKSDSQFRSKQSAPYPKFRQRLSGTSRPANSSSTFCVPQHNSESDSDEEAHASSASFVVRTPQDASGEGHPQYLIDVAANFCLNQLQTFAVNHCQMKPGDSNFMSA